MANELFNNWSAPESEDRLALVFEDKNKAYGAFFVRSKYRKAKVISAAIACLFVLILSGGPLIHEIYFGKDRAGKKRVKVQNVKIDDIPDEKEEEKKPEEIPPPDAPKQQVASQAFTVPEIDPTTTQETPPKDPRFITNPGSQDQKGVDDPTLEVVSGTPGGPIDNNGDNNGAPVKADVDAIYPGGMEKFYAYVESEFQYPPRCLDEGISGYVMLRFVVDTRGRISSVSMVEETPSCKEFTQEAIRVLMKSKAWIPGIVKGRAVKSYRMVPIKLQISPN